MQLLVFGASGRVGRRICEYAHSDGHGVTAFVRDAAVRGGHHRERVGIAY